MALTSREIDEVIQRKFNRLTQDQKSDPARAIHTIWKNIYIQMANDEITIRSFLTADQNQELDERATDMANQLNNDPALATAVDSKRI